MDPFDPLRNIRHLLDGLRPAMEQYEQIQRQLRDASVSLRVQDVLLEYEKAHLSLTTIPDFAATTRALAAAVQPLTIDFAQFAPLAGFTVMSELMTRVNAGIDQARFLGEIEFSSEEAIADSQDGALTREAESKLVEIVSAEALEDLRRVEFAPLVLLDRALRDPEIMRRLNAREFEGFVAALVEELGFEDVVLTPRSGDAGRDVLATKRIHGIAVMCAFECKKYAPNRPVGPDVARALLGTITHSGTRVAKGVLVTTSYFTPSARTFILTEPTLDGKDFDGIVAWLQEHGSKTRRAT
jgi:hypothetical protein